MPSLPFTDTPGRIWHSAGPTLADSIPSFSSFLSRRVFHAVHRPCAHRVFRVRQHRHHCRNLRQFHPGPVRSHDQAGPQALCQRPAEGRGADRRDQPHLGQRGRPSHRVFHAGQSGNRPRHQREGPCARAGHVCDVPQSTRKGAGDQVTPPGGPLLRHQPEQGLCRPDRGHQLQPVARRRPDQPRSGAVGCDPDWCEPQRQDAHLAVSGHAAWAQGIELPAHSRGLRAHAAASGSGALQAQAVRTHH